MHGRSREAVRRGGVRGCGGYSMVEMMIALAMAVLVGAGLYFVFTSQQRASRSQKTYNDLQTSCSFALDTIKSDLLLAGYRAKNPVEPISGAGANAITFEFWDDNASYEPPYDDITQFTNHTQVSYALTGTDLTKTVRRWHTPGAGAYDTPLTFVLSQDVAGLSFEYFKEDNLPWTSVEAKDLIRTVRVSLQCRAGQKDALYATGPERHQAISLSAEVRPRNIAVSENPEDKTPPAVPLSEPGAAMKVWDEGQCGCLQLKWTSNSDSDIAGYTVYYGFAAGSYVGRARVVHQAGANQYYTLRNLAAANVPYFIALAAYDKSGNQSALCTPVSANPDPSVRTEGGTGNDTAITPLPPPAPGAPAVATPADNQIQVSWTKTYSDCLTNSVFGYRVYRSADPNFVPRGASAGLGNCIADESTLGPTATSFLDTGADTPAGYLIGCVPYYYKVATVTCDPSQLTNYTDPGAGTTTNYTAAQFAGVSGTPTDGTRTSSPTLTSKAGYRRIILSLTNPSRAAGQHPDFMFTRIYFSTNGFPVITETRDAEGYNIVTDPGGGPARLIPDGGGVVATGGGPTTVNFDDEDAEIPNGDPAGIGNPQLNKDQTYYFLAVAYDRCKNHSEDTEQARSTAEQCSDCLAGETCRDAPPAAADLRVTQGCDGAPLRLEWSYDPGNYITNPDFQGFRVVRCQGAGCVPMDPVHGGSGTVLGGTYLSPDTHLLDDTVVDGQVYNYRVYAGDCYYQRWLEGEPPTPEGGDPSNNAATTDLAGVALGFFDRAHVVGDLQTTLTESITAWQDTIPVASTVGWTHRRLLINTEIVECNGVTATAFTDCWWRGAEGTIAIPHLAGTPVRSYPPSPARAAVTGDLSIVPPTFLHNFVLVGARNTSAGQLTLRQLESEWVDPNAWFTKLLYDNSTVGFEDTSPFEHPYSGSTAVLQPITVEPMLNNIPLKLTFLKADGSVDSSLDLREEPITLRWQYRNNATGLDTCERAWEPPAPAGIVAPAGPSIAGTTQSLPTWGTVAWPVPGLQNNPLDAIIVPSSPWSNFIMTNVHDTSGTGVASVRLYYAATHRDVDQPPAVTGPYPGCDPYTMVEMTNWFGTEIWSASFPAWPAQPSAFNDQNVWFYLVAVDNEGNFDREPEVNQGAFQYFQQPEDPCLNTPRAPELTGSADAGSVMLDWSASWWGPPPIYYNTDWSVCSDLGGFRVYHQIGNRSWTEVAGSPFPATTQDYTHNFTTRTTSLTWQVPATLASPLALSVSDPSAFLIPGKVKIGDEVFRCAGRDAWHFNGCVRAQDGTLAADHALGAAVTQDLLALENNSFFVRAFDTCGAGAKYSDSAIYTEGFCTPRCRLEVWPSGTSLAPGASFWLQVQACEKAGNGSTDTIYVHTCSSVEGDEVPITESGDSGWFSASVATLLGTTASGGQTTLVVRDEDTISIGGFASAQNLWGNINDCNAYSYGCGAAQTITVHTPPPDVCLNDHTPGTPAGLSAARVAGDVCSGSGTSRMTLSWNKVAPTPDCTSISYRGYLCEGDGCAPTIPINGFFTSEAANCGAGTTCTSNVISVAPSKISNKVYRFAVSAVCEINNCPTAPTTRTWEGAMSGVIGDACP